jgi:hypothetical protein
MASLRPLYKSGIIQIRPAHRNKGYPGARRLRRIQYTAACAHPPWLGPDRPLMPDSIPPRRNGRPCGTNPNAVHDRVPGYASDIARIGRPLRSSKCRTRQHDILAKATSQQKKKPIQLSLPVLHVCACSLALKTHALHLPRLDPETRATTYSALEHPQPTPASYVLCPSAPPHMQALTLHTACRTSHGSGGGGRRRRRRLLAHMGLAFHLQGILSADS